MERTIKITNAVETTDSIEVSYDVCEGDVIVAQGVKHFSLKSKKESIESHLQYMLEKGAYESGEVEEEILISPAETILQITGLEVKSKKEDNEK